jgi:hypothetical protein
MAPGLKDNKHMEQLYGTIQMAAENDLRLSITGENFKDTRDRVLLAAGHERVSWRTNAEIKDFATRLGLSPDDNSVRPLTDEEARKKPKGR